MKYEEIVEKVKKAYSKADTALVGEHLAVQVNVTGEGEGAFYIEIANGTVNVEPYEYFDRDFIISCQADVILDIAAGKKKLVPSVEAGEAFIGGNYVWEKVALFDNISVKKATVKKTVETVNKSIKDSADKVAKEEKKIDAEAKKAATEAKKAAAEAKKAEAEKVKAEKKAAAEAKKAEAEKAKAEKKAAAEAKKAEAVKAKAEKKAVTEKKTATDSKTAAPAKKSAK